MKSQAGFFTREQITTELTRFGIKCQDRMLTYALAGMGIRASSHENLPSPKRGRRDLYDPITVWTIASAHRGLEGAFHKRKNELEVFRVLWDEMSAMSEAALLPEFTADREFGAQVLSITSSNRGMGASAVIRRVHADLTLLDLCSAGPAFMEVALTAYKDVSGTWLLEEPLVQEDGRDMTPELLRRWYAETWVLKAAALVTSRQDADATSDSR
jgi:hypothetical protein